MSFINYQILKNTVKKIMPKSLLVKYRLFKSVLMRVEKRKKELIENMRSLSKENNEHPLYIVTLTSYGKRLEKTTPYAIASILNQTVLPDRIVLWVGYDTTLPQIIVRFRDKGVDVMFCEDMKSYKKLVPALQKYPKDILITADDDILYPINWFEKLKKEHKKHPDHICFHRAHKIKFGKKNYILPYNKWDKCVKSKLFKNENSIYKYNLFPTGCSGVLYPPNSLYSQTASKELFMKLCPTGDDIWFWAMALLQGTKYSMVENGYRVVEEIDVTDPGLLNTVNAGGGNDMQIRAVMEHFPELENFLRYRK